MKIQKIISLLKSGAEGCRSAASEHWVTATISQLHSDAACLDELAEKLRAVFTYG